MRGGGSWLPLLWAMIAFLIVVKAVDLLKPVVKRKLQQWRNRHMYRDTGQSVEQDRQ